MQAKAGLKKAVAAKRMSARRSTRKNAAVFQGEKRGLIILVQFADKAFSMGKPQPLYDRIANEQGYSDHGFNGSVRDYFIAQSGGKFTLDFDVVGPVTLDHGYSYYGGNDRYGDDLRAEEMISEACKAVDDSVDFSRYDWDGDGEVEEVFVLYAGKGENDGGSASTVWPHMYWLSAATAALTLDGVKVDTYACSSELNGEDNVAGIGTFCHEFSHCMGFPDMYDTGNAGNFGMGSWDLMDYGSYNGDGYTPAGYSGYEKWVCGWTEPVELTADTAITNVQPLSEMGQSYIVYNKGNRNEYYILENRQQRGYDAALPGHGLLIEHVDYDEKLWNENVVNTTDDEDYPNDHQRITVFHANNLEYSSYEKNAVYPFKGNDSLTNYSQPAATVYNANSDGSHYMNCAIRNITENADGTMSFVFGNFTTPSKSDSDTIVVVPTGDVLFKETFDKCGGKGGNDGRFSGTMNTAPLTDDYCDNAGWSFGKGYPASQCARFGTAKVVGRVESPKFTLSGDTATLSFKAACWDNEKDGTDLTVSLGGDVRLVGSDGKLTMKRGEWTTYTLKFVGSGTTYIVFNPNQRFFLDEVLVTGKPVPAGVKPVSAARPAGDSRIYNLGGQYVGRDLKALPKGIYIVGGKKVVR